MLSRLAESFYWIGCYIERAEANTSVAEHHQLLVEDTRVLPTDGCRVLLDALSLGRRRTESDQHATRFGPRGTGHRATRNDRWFGHCSARECPRNSRCAIRRCL